MWQTFAECAANSQQRHVCAICKQCKLPRKIYIGKKWMEYNGNATTAKKKCEHWKQSEPQRSMKKALYTIRVQTIHMLWTQHMPETKQTKPMSRIGQSRSSLTAWTSSHMCNIHFSAYILIKSIVCSFVLYIVAKWLLHRSLWGPAAKYEWVTGKQMLHTLFLDSSTLYYASTYSCASVLWLFAISKHVPHMLSKHFFPHKIHTKWWRDARPCFRTCFAHKVGLFVVSLQLQLNESMWKCGNVHYTNVCVKRTYTKRLRLVWSRQFGLSKASGRFGYRPFLKTAQRLLCSSELGRFHVKENKSCGKAHRRKGDQTQIRFKAAFRVSRCFFVFLLYTHAKI